MTGTATHKLDLQFSGTLGVAIVMCTVKKKKKRLLLGNCPQLKTCVFPTNIGEYTEFLRDTFLDTWTCVEIKFTFRD